MGDAIIGYNEGADEIDVFYVEATHKQVHETTLELTINGEVVHTTEEHPFLVMDGDNIYWMEAGQLQEGDTILAADGTTGIVEAVAVIDEPQIMYNLTISLVATYLVGEQGWVVHNTQLLRNCSYAPYKGAHKREQSGLSIANQSAIVGAIRAIEPDAVIGARPRALGAAYLDGIIRNKPVSAKKIGDDLYAGARLVKVPQVKNVQGDRLNTYRTMVAISDLDIGVVARRQGKSFQNISDDQFISMIFDPRDQILLPNPQGKLLGNMINDLNGAEIVMHGSLHNGLIDPSVRIGIDTPGFRKYIYNEYWFYFNSDGWFATTYANNWISKNLPDVWTSILASGDPSL